MSTICIRIWRQYSETGYGPSPGSVQGKRISRQRMASSAVKPVLLHFPQVESEALAELASHTPLAGYLRGAEEVQEGLE